MPRVRLLVSALLLALVAGAPAAPPAAAQAGGTLSLRAAGVFHDGTTALALTAHRWEVRGTVDPFVAGQVVTVDVVRDGDLLRRRIVPLAAGAGGRGGFTVAMRVSAAGRVVVRARHAATPQQGELVAAPVRVTVVRPRLAAGSRGPLVRVVQSRLARLRYAVGRTDGVFAAATGRAVLAYRKVNRMARTEVVDDRMIHRLLALRGAFRPRRPAAGRRVEADVGRQVLALLVGSRVHAVFTMSSGKPSTPTVLGRFRFYAKRPGFNASAMYYSSYFLRGYAVHGYASVPPYPASHGCLRVPMADAVTIYGFIRIGDPIDVYG